ncbi:MAG: hypothetical protein GTO53_14635 [Planctomycetales bacterium]|nr:hypothetical protein [Planctomycetales bacterium]NIM10319.1 hypothetical protein [Planctomycetales bacterium]NIN09766.1 hypothetical protein [Planctomycetales bacterium]NIN78889.1 hypothetical protein [Planctomycetales bacterium]NIO36060.1 hypothetical protein [Planctomycetales bacterium]
MKTTTKDKNPPAVRRNPQASSEQGDTSNRQRPVHSGIHNRRDKRIPFRSTRIRPEDVAEARAYEAEHQEAEVAQQASEWQEALMLWLSWNSTYEKLTAKMCKEGQNQEKLERLMDELDELRSRALQISEQIISQEQGG